MTTDTVPVEFKKKETLAHKLIPLIFLVGVFAFDQITKFLVVKNIPLYTIKFSFFGDLLRLKTVVKKLFWAQQTHSVRLQ